MNPVDELTRLLPPAPADRDLPRAEQHTAGLLAAIAGPDHPGARPWWRLPAATRVTAPAAVAVAIAVVAVLAVAVPRLIHSGTAGAPAAPGRFPPAGQSGAPAPGAPLTAARQWSVPAGEFSQVAASTNTGTVTITGASTGPAQITATPRFYGSAPVVTSRISGGTLTVRATCPQNENCQVTLRLTIPSRDDVTAGSGLGDAAVSGLSGDLRVSSGEGNVSLHDVSGSIRATAGEGDIDVSGMTGQLTANAGAGDITLRDVAGHVSATAREGSVTGLGLTASRATLTSGEGDVTATFSAPPSLLVASCPMGSVTLRLPDSASYAVTARAPMGSTSVRVPQAPGSVHVIKATSQMGSVTITGASG